MWKIVFAVIIALVLIKVLPIVLVIVIEGIDYIIFDRSSECNRKVKSSLREAFELECSKEMIAADSYAKKLDKAIRKMDSQKSRLARKQRKMNERFSKIKC